MRAVRPFDLKCIGLQSPKMKFSHRRRIPAGDDFAIPDSSSRVVILKHGMERPSPKSFS